MRVDVFSDVVCPWCRIGKARFAEAVEQLGWGDDVEVVHRPFELPVRPGQRPRPSTFDAHRLLEWALATGGPGAQSALLDRLFAAVHDEKVRADDHGALARCAAEVGLDGGAAADVLAGDAYADEVRASLAEATDRDIYGVPTFVFESGLCIPGAQEVDTFTSLLRRIAARP